MTFRGTTPTFTREMGYNPPRARGQNTAPARMISQARMAEEFHDAYRYRQIHANPSEHIQLYDNPPDNRGSDLINYLHQPFYNRQTSEVPLTNQMLNSYVGFIEGDLNSYVGQPRPGETMSSPRVRLVDSLYNNDYEKYTGFRYGSNYAKAKYGIDSPAYGDSDYIDMLPELIENVPPLDVTKMRPDLLEIEKDRLEKAGAFNYPNRIELVSLQNRYPYRPGNTYPDRQRQMRRH